MEGGIKDLYPLKPWEELENNSNKLKEGCDCIGINIERSGELRDSTENKPENKQIYSVK